MSRTRSRDTVLTRIEALKRHARAIESALAHHGPRGEARQVIDTLGEAEAWLRGQPSPEVVTHIARMVADAGRRLYDLGRELA